MASRTPAKLDRDQLWDYALRSLGRRAQSVAEIRQKLARRAASNADIPEILARLNEYGITDDRRFSEAFASSRLSNQGFGSMRVLRDLRSKRIASPVAAAAVEQAYAGSEESGLIDAFLVRKYRGKNLKEFFSEQKNFASAYRRLRLAGFSHGATIDGLKRHSSLALEEWPEPDLDDEPAE